MSGKGTEICSYYLESFLPSEVLPGKNMTFAALHCTCLSGSSSVLVDCKPFDLVHLFLVGATRAALTVQSSKFFKLFDDPLHKLIEDGLRLHL